MPNKRGDHQYHGLRNKKSSTNYRDAERVVIGGTTIRKLLPRELAEWRAHFAGVVQLNTRRRAVV